MAYSWGHPSESRPWHKEIWSALWFIPANIVFMLFIAIIFIAHGRKAALHVMHLFDQH